MKDAPQTVRLRLPSCNAPRHAECLFLYVLRGNVSRDLSPCLVREPKIKTVKRGAADEITKGGPKRREQQSLVFSSPESEW